MNKTLTMKELPDPERPYEKCLSRGAAALSDAELISVVIRTGSAGERCTDLAARVLNAGPDGILNLIHLSAKELTQIRGIGPVKAVQLKCVGELSRRIAAASRHVSPVLSEPEEIAAYYMERMRHEAKEVLVLAMFDRKNMFLGDEVISVGTSNASLISPGEIFRTALRSRAEFLILLHNHPSGDPEPSREDIDVTSRLGQCGQLLGIPLMDHIIIGDNCFFSFCEEGLLACHDI
ncbi:MAG: DNA repair protein RadC [Clostridiales bacterium]|nr:DNA repair protein RadC [Clostridiales bacterium]